MIFKEKIFYIIFLFTCASFSQSEQKIDSLQRLLHLKQTKVNQAEINLKISKLIFNKYQDSSNIYAKKAEKIAQKNHNTILLSDSYLQQGINFYKQRKDDIALSYFNKIDSLFVKEPKIVKAYFMSKIYRSEISKFTFTLEGVKQAKLYILEALVLAKKNKNEKQINLAKYRLAEWHGFISQEEFTKEHLDTARFYINSVIPYYKRIKDYDFSAKSYHTLASIEVASKNLPKATYYYKKRLEIIKKTKDSAKIGDAYQSLGPLYRKLNQPNKGLAYLDSAWAMLKNTGFRTQKRKKDLYKDYAYLYELKKDYKKAFDKMYQALVLKDTIYEMQTINQAMELEKKYQLKKEKEKIKLITKLAKKQKYIYWSLLGLLITIGVVLFYAYQNKIKTSKKINQLNELKSRFFANISHEFRTPLTLIKSPLQSLQAEITDKKQQKKLQLIEKNSNRILDLINQLLELAKLDNGKLQLLLKEGHLSSFIHSIIEPFVFQANENKRNFSFNIEKTTKTYCFDKDILQKIITNLLSNAFKHSSKEAKIYFKATVQGKQLNVEVSNTNSDLKKEDISKFFERFFQKKSTHQGFGIGLSLVKELVALCKGNIKVYIEKDIISFKVSLPLETTNTNAIIINKECPDAIITNPIKETELPILLIVDDNPNIRMVLKELFQTDYYVLEAQNGKQALKIAKKEIPDAIVSDVMMPKIDGFEFTKEIKTNELTSFIPIVLLTAKTSDQARLKGIQNTADAFLTKPFNHNILKTTVHQLILERKKLQERYSQELILKPVDIKINSVDEKFLKKLQHVLQKELANADFTTDNFASEMAMSRMQLHRKLKTLLGVSATEFLRKERIKVAAELLKKDEGNISEILYSVGFNNRSYFDKCFKEIYHCTPTEFASKNS